MLLHADSSKSVCKGDRFCIINVFNIKIILEMCNSAVKLKHLLW